MSVCEDMARQLGTDAYAPDVECPPWATCETCGSCEMREPFALVGNEPLKAALERTCGLCVADPGMSMVVMLDALPCGGDGWWPR